jgi:hypothetical protein
MFSGSCDSRGSSSVVMFGDSPFPIAEASLRLPRLSTPRCRCCGGPHRNDVYFVYVSSTDTVMNFERIMESISHHMTTEYPLPKSTTRLPLNIIDFPTRVHK